MLGSPFQPKDELPSSLPNQIKYVCAPLSVLQLLLDSPLTGYLFTFHCWAQIFQNTRITFVIFKSIFLNIFLHPTA